MIPFICYNGKVELATNTMLSIDDKAFKFGSGYFDTLKVIKGKIRLKDYHFNRIAASAKKLGFSLPTSIDEIEKQLLLLCNKNNCIDSARVRISFSEGNGLLFHKAEQANYLIEASSFANIDDAPLAIDVFPNHRKISGSISNIKLSGNILYSLASNYAMANQLDDCLIINETGNIIESIISNIFWIKNRQVHTVPLNEGCVAGVMRAFLIENITVTQQTCTIEQLLDADEIFLTNALRGIRPVSQFKQKMYATELSEKLKNKLIIH